MKQTKTKQNKSKQIPKKYTKFVKKPLSKKEEAKKEAALNSMAKCLAMSLILSKEAFESLSPDMFTKLFGDWKLRELKLLRNIYKEGLTKEKKK